MLDNLDADSGVVIKPTLSWPRLWLAALIRPTPSVYQEIGNNAQITPQTACIWLLGSGLVSGLLSAAGGVFAGSGSAWGGSLALAALIFALAQVCACLLLAVCVHGVVHLLGGGLLGGRGVFQKLIKVFAAINVPLALLAGVLAPAQRVDLLQWGLYLYWLYLYGMATVAMYRVSWVKAAGSIFIALLILAVVVLGFGGLLML